MLIFSLMYSDNENDNNKVKTIFKEGFGKKIWNQLNSHEFLETF